MEPRVSSLLYSQALLGCPGGWAGSKPESSPVPAFVPLSALGSMGIHASTSGLEVLVQPGWN